MVALLEPSDVPDDQCARCPGDLAGAIQIGKSWALFGTADLWIGALAGAAMIYAAIRLRRWRDDN